jgi:hypothetical protein
MEPEAARLHDGWSQGTDRGSAVNIILWIVLILWLLGSIELVVYAARHRSAASVNARRVRPPRR